jgi:hypothetical protein
MFWDGGDPWPSSGAAAYACFVCSMVPTPDEAASRRREAAGRYRPDQVRLLLVAHAPPKALDRYFYFESVPRKDDLFRYVIRGLFGSFPERSDKPLWLERLRSEGVFMIDLIERPYDGSDLGDHAVRLADRARALEPDHVILIKADVFDAAFTHLREQGLPVVPQRISFPSSGRQREFEASFATALEEIGWGSAG